MIVALPAIAAAFLMLLTTSEPERGATEDALKVINPGFALLFLALRRMVLSCRSTAGEFLHSTRSRCHKYLHLSGLLPGISVEAQFEHISAACANHIRTLWLC